MIEPRTDDDWISDCIHWRGVVLKGKAAHWCYDWDGLPVDETTGEWSACTCFTSAEKASIDGEITPKETKP